LRARDNGGVFVSRPSAKTMTDRRFPPPCTVQQLPDVPDPDQHRLKADMAVVIGRAIKRQGLTVAAAAERLGISAPHLAHILCGQFSGYSLPRVIAMASALTGIAPQEWKE
jgi:predicted XRE-type DNA-binding protein